MALLGDAKRLTPVNRVARMMKEHMAGVLNYFERRNTEAVSEGLNTKVAAIKKIVYGLRDKDHFRTAVLFK